MCKPSRYAVIARDGETITYGFRCAKHGVPSKRFSTRELREQHLKQHKKENKK